DPSETGTIAVPCVPLPGASDSRTVPHSSHEGHRPAHWANRWPHAEHANETRTFTAATGTPASDTRPCHPLSLGSDPWRVTPNGSVPGHKTARGVRPSTRRAVCRYLSREVIAVRVVKLELDAIGPAPAPIADVLAAAPVHPLVLVTWRDAFFDLDQTTSADFRADYLVHTVGFLVADGPTFVSLAQERLPRDDGF